MYTAESWSTNEEFEDAERLLESIEKRDGSTRFPKDLSPEETTMPTKQDGAHSPENISWNYDDIEVDISPRSSGAIGAPEGTTMPSGHDDAQSLPNISCEMFQNFLSALCDGIEPDVWGDPSDAPSASPAFIHGKRKYDSTGDLKTREKMAESFLKGIERLLNPGYASRLRESITALSTPALNRFMNTFRFHYNAYLSGRADAGETVSKMALKRVLSYTFESLADDVAIDYK